MHIDPADLRLTTLEQIYASTDAGCNPAAALCASRQLLGGDKAVMLQLAISGHDGAILASSGADHEFAARLLEQRDASGNFISHFRSWDQDNTYDAARLVRTADMLNSDFYRDFLEPHDVHHAIAGVIRRNATSCTVLCIYRTADNLAFDQRAIDQLRELLPHWRRALDLRNRLAQLNQQSDIAHCILNHAPFAIMTVDTAGLILYANQHAKIISRLNDGLRVRDGHIAASSLSGTRKLLAELQRCEQQRSQPMNGMPIPFPLERPSGAKPYQLLIMPVDTSVALDYPHGGTFGIFVYDPTHRLPVDSAALKSLEGLTDSEARLCESLYETKNLGESAEQLNVSLSTAKTHLLNTFRKLGINSQAELMRYLAHMPKMLNNQLQ